MQRMNKQPRIEIERFGLEAIPTAQKQTKWFEYAGIQLAFSVNTGNVLVPALAVLTGGLSVGWAVTSTILGAVLAFLLVSLLSLPGARYGLPAQFVIRTMIGTRLSRYFASPIRSLTSLYWFSVQTIGGSMVFISLLTPITGVSIPLWLIAPILSAGMAVLALIGFDAVKKATKWFLPILFLGQGAMIYLILTHSFSASSSIFETGDFHFTSFFFFSSLAFVQYVSGVSASSDMTRYAKSPKQAFWGVLAGNAAGFVLTAFLGTLYAAALGSLNPFASAGELTDSYLLLAIIATGALVSMISINLSNAYTGGYSLLNAFPALGRIKSAVLFGAAATLLSFFPIIVEQAEQYISMLGAAVIPLSAIIVFDFIFIKKGRILEIDLRSLSSGKNVINFEALLTAIIFIPVYLIIPSSFSPGFIVFLLAGFTYSALKYHRFKKRN
ncbi:purine-cytosine permease family protein [Jeotgalibacillus campisalis]|uniref:Cytosine permease n=1 Tax=Jeotgalibacillus campisalis TaxID=220754 RepID=A0A0C2R7U5_9BACL|nr:cytosine permease [Jeotgalibacillus campisalis]KIL46320.1 cytosine permease [Jeotgalibacillus campisalis]